MNSLETNSSNKSEATHQLASQTNKSTNGNRTTNRRYGSRSFSGKERNMSQRNNSNYNGGGGGGGYHHQQQQNYSQRNPINYNKYSSASTTVRHYQQQHQLQPPNFYPSGVMDQQSRQISPSVGCNEAIVRSNSAESQKCRVSCFQY